VPLADYTIFERNMLALSTSTSYLVTKRLREAVSSENLSFEPARSGALIPILSRGGRQIGLHSRFDPEEEGRRIAQGFSQRGFYIFLGLGAGYGIQAFLQNDRISRGIIIDFDAGLIRSILETIDLTHILADKRLEFLVDPTEAELQALFVSTYIPSLYGNLSVVPLRSRVDDSNDVFQGAADCIKRLMEAVSDDYSVQAFFGKRWFTNIVRNMKKADGNTPPIGPIHRAAITAAGPSLELFVEELRALPPEVFLIATDTSLNVLLGHGIVPHAVITIDCQHISYFHFMKKLPPKLPVFMDLATPPTVARLTGSNYFFSSGHPLARYVASRFRAFPCIDTSGGNVTHAAISLADYLGAATIDLYGADLSYPFGKAYARGSYVYPYFDLRQSRLKPVESLFSHFLFRNQSLTREHDASGRFRYITKPLVAYRERLERLASQGNFQLIPHSGNGIMIKALPPAQPRKDQGRMFAAGKTFQPARQFLEEYRQAIDELGQPVRPVGYYMGNLSARERDIWMTLLPTAAAIRRELADKDPEPEKILELTRQWCISRIDEALKAY